MDGGNHHSETPIDYGTCLSESEYLKVEEASKERHEYVAGRLFAMSGNSYPHNIIVANIVTSIRDFARRYGCQIVSNDMKVKIEELNVFYYPDVIGTCEKPAPGLLYLTNPFLVVEVLSPSTMTIDRREKLLAYQPIKSLREYLVVSQDSIEIEFYRKDEGNWNCWQLTRDDVASFCSIPGGQLDIPVRQIYASLEYLL